MRGLGAGLALLALALALLPAPARAAASGWVGGPTAQARLITAEQATGSSGTVDAGLEIRLSPGWHVYWRDPGAAGLPPAISWHGSRNLAGAELSWPAPRRFVLGGLQAYGYAGRVVLPIALTLARPGAPLALQASVTYLACSTICVPHQAALSLLVRAGLARPGPQAGLIAAARAQVPSGLSRLGLTLARTDVAPDGAGHALLVLAFEGPGAAKLRNPDLFVEGLPNDAAPGPPRLSPAAGADGAILTLGPVAAAPSALAARPLTFTLTGAALTGGPGRAATFRAAPTLVAADALPGPTLIPLFILLAALFGGLVLNVMPCVLPVLTLKLMALAFLAGAERRAIRRDLLTTAAGILAGFAALALGLIGLKAAGAAIGWGIQFQEPWFLAAMTMIMVLFAADLWGWIAIALPPALAPAAGSRPFLTGLFATLLATSCTAPVVGTAVGFALARGPTEILLIFLAMGVGFAAPYLAAAAAPALVRLLPRPGGWMVVLARIFGLLLLGTAVWLLSVLLRVAGPAAAFAVGALSLLLLALLFWRRFHFASAAAFLAIAAMAVSEVLASPPAPPLEATGSWQSFSQAAITSDIAHGKTVFVDVTAAWCLICQV
ncbi:MAG TPA: protein-disulfide reductase DsbD domain-containing protein, partial [Acetobacteraceae bacterium]|nr:protein-disulfide reductase DsbD domain-containing protein [Acetobacteraceae bacterium]